MVRRTVNFYRDHPLPLLIVSGLSGALCLFGLFILWPFGSDGFLLFVPLILSVILFAWSWRRLLFLRRTLGVMSVLRNSPGAGAADLILQLAGGRAAAMEIMNEIVLEIDRRRDARVHDWSLVCGFVITYAEMAGAEALPVIERICRDPFWRDETGVASTLEGARATVRLRNRI